MLGREIRRVARTRPESRGARGEPDAARKHGRGVSSALLSRAFGEWTPTGKLKNYNIRPIGTVVTGVRLTPCIKRNFSRISGRTGRITTPMPSVGRPLVPLLGTAAGALMATMPTLMVVP